jgi:hypothetical protein
MPAFGGGMSVRTIWITLRAINYTTQAFAMISRDIGNLQKSEKELIKHTNDMRNAAIKFISAGMMFTVLGLMVGNTLFSMAAASAEGAAAMAELNAKFEMTKQTLGGAIYEILKAIHVFDFLNYILDAIRQNPVLAYLIGGLLIMAAAAAIVLGGLLLLSGAMLIFVGQSKLMYGWNLMNAYSLKFLNMELKTLGASLGLAFGAFMLLYEVGKMLGPWAALVIGIILTVVAALIKLYIAESMSTLGFAAIIGGIAAGTAAGIAAGYGLFAQGTRSVPRTGPAIVHKGEVIYNPSTGRPTQIANDIEGNAGTAGRSGVTNIPITIENVNTKADVDDLDDELQRSLRKRMRERR